jgi:signal transduction histidine kinase/ActR/RegA family two-component response regulator
MTTPTTDEPLVDPGAPIDTLARITGIFFLYSITALVGLSIYSVNTYAALIWPPAGIALAGFLLYGGRVWPAVLAAALLVNLHLGATLPVALGIALGNTIGPAIGASLLKWYTAYRSYHPAFPRLRDNIGIMVAAVLIPIATATIGITSLWLGNDIVLSTLTATWTTWWLGDLLGILIMTPFLLKWFNQSLFDRTQAQQIELFLSLVVVTATSYVVFWIPDTQYVYYIFIPLTWAALRTGQRGTTLSIVLVSSVAVWATYMGHGPFAPGGLVSLQLFLIAMSGILLVFASAVEERRNVVEKLEQHTHDLEIALQAIRSEDEAKKEFIAVLAHELRNPLATILSSIELIHLQGFSAANTSELLTTINERSRAMVRLLDDLLDISRISKKKLVLQKETLSVSEFMDKLEKIVRPLMKRYGHTFSLTKPEEGLYLSADPVRLEQILMNLLANAARYTKTHGSIEVISGPEDHMLAIHIRDSGVGIPRGMLRRIFEPFFQVDRGNISTEGMGIGLPLTRELVEMHGGSIEAKSGGIGQGAEFIVRLPLTKAPEETPTIPLISSASAMKEHAHAPRPIKNAHRILIVDDNEAATDALSQLLSIHGHTTAVALTGASAIQKAQEFGPEIIFLDIGLPDMTGYEVAVKLRQQNTSYFIIALTGYGQTDDKDKAKRAGINQHLTKPAGLKEIQAVLRKYPRSKK